MHILRRLRDSLKKMNMKLKEEENLGKISEEMKLLALDTILTVSNKQKFILCCSYWSCSCTFITAFSWSYDEHEEVIHAQEF